MLLTASTIKDSLDNVQFWVAANLASGIDHMFVFLDAPRDADQREVGAWLDAHPQVTCLRTGRRDWWGGERPGSLNVRQRINVNWARSLLAPLPWAQWLFHVDGDEVVRADRDTMAAVPAESGAVWLPPLEAVSQLRPDGRPTRFKPLLEPADLNLLHVLGVLAEPTNQDYFHGHVMGKSGVRPASGLALTLHGAISAQGERQERHEAPGLAVLHYDAVSGEEFVRKWEALASAGPARYRASRAPMARALRSLAGRDLPEPVRRKYLERIYDLTTRDDVETLGELDLLVEVDPLHRPAPVRPLPDGAAQQLADRVEELRAQPKQPYFVAEAGENAKGARGGQGGRGAQGGAREGAATAKDRPRGLGRLLSRD